MTRQEILDVVRTDSTRTRSERQTLIRIANGMLYKATDRHERRIVIAKVGGTCSICQCSREPGERRGTDRQIRLVDGICIDCRDEPMIGLDKPAADHLAAWWPK